VSDARVVHGDCLEVLRDLPDGCVTAIVTDPPYGLEFMGKGWDKVQPPTEVWREALRVLRPGGHALVFGGTRAFHRLTCAMEDAGFEIRDCLAWMYGQGFPKSKNLDGEFAGFGTALKPAWEPIILARKPLVGTVERNCREHGTGALNIDGCRIESGERPHIERRNDKALDGDVYGSGINGSRSLGTFTEGRWPANVVLDEEAAAMLDEQAPDKGQAAPLKATGRPRPGHGRLGEMGPPVPCKPHDVPGGASRFFYCAKASKRDRGEGNNHPTVKPVELMRWLVRLVRGPGENLVLDPFAGSGTTGIACALEGVPFLLVEREVGYVEIIRSRLRAAGEQEQHG